MVPSNLMDQSDEEPEIGGEEQPPQTGTSPAPGAYLYRGALVALAIGSAIAVYLVLSPPEDESTQSIVRSFATNTPVVEATASPTPEGQQPTSTPTALPPTATPESPTETATPESGATIEYTVKSGDFLSTIAEDHGVSVDAILERNPGMDPDLISVGQVILIPAP